MVSVWFGIKIRFGKQFADLTYFYLPKEIYILHRIKFIREKMTRIAMKKFLSQLLKIKMTKIVLNVLSKKSKYTLISQ